MSDKTRPVTRMGSADTSASSSFSEGAGLSPTRDLDLKRLDNDPPPTLSPADVDRVLAKEKLPRRLVDAMATQILQGRSHVRGVRLIDVLTEDAARHTRAQLDEALGKAIGPRVMQVARQAASEETIQRVVAQAIEQKLPAIVRAHLDTMLDEIVAREVTDILHDEIEKTTQDLAKRIRRSVSITMAGLGNRLADEA